MNLESQVCTLAQAKRLYRLGAPTHDKALFIWNGGQLVRYSERHLGLESYAAFTSAELGEMLPSEVMTEREPGIECRVWVASSNDYEVAFPACTEAEAKAEMLIWLLSRGHYSAAELAESFANAF